MLTSTINPAKSTTPAAVMDDVIGLVHVPNGAIFRRDAIILAAQNEFRQGFVLSNEGIISRRGSLTAEISEYQVNIKILTPTE